ncbi:hypothetical protein A3D78_07655 [Candidatus Gottesmanbacteria bacterium RIFCSPHIGHO2_02_FULL_39_14]|uniref:Uncharacterized protein n=1 Tax=Candidatus Gottesmanbacteria bacterium RIFCSPHIGHO2_02_FULL_39_14 TaxID=1798383 RepID=A0A1F5ZW08_9BACT|nr:MAG: hypothetical protein A3D78_07655 [Candidatus Gottesmanbacteria bacterium RIFCSPHIGHO2_02_FULL_39_14]
MVDLKVTDYHFEVLKPGLINHQTVPYLYLFLPIKLPHRQFNVLYHFFAGKIPVIYCFFYQKGVLGE